MKIKRKTFERVVLSSKIGLALLAILLSAYLLFGTDIFRITSYEIEGLDDVTKISLREQLEKDSGYMTYYIFPHNHILTFNSKRIRDISQKEVPDASLISVRRSGLQALTITFLRFDPVLRTADGYLINKEGVLFYSKIQNGIYPIITIASSSVIDATYNKLPVKKITAKHFSFNESYLENLLDFLDKITTIIFPVSSIVVTSDGDTIMYDEREYSKVLFLHDGDLEKTWSTLVSAIDTDPLKTKLEKDKEKLLYLDVRFGNKVFYKFGDGFQQASSPAIIDDYDTSAYATSTTN